MESMIRTSGIFLGAFGAFLQEFGIVRSCFESYRRNCNDSKATRMLYYSMGLSCEFLAVGLLEFSEYTFMSKC